MHAALASPHSDRNNIMQATLETSLKNEEKNQTAECRTPVVAVTCKFQYKVVEFQSYKRLRVNYNNLPLLEFLKLEKIQKSFYHHISDVSVMHV